MPKAIELWSPNLSFTMISSTVYNFFPLFRGWIIIFIVANRRREGREIEKKGMASNLKHEESIEQKYWVLLKINLKKLIKILMQMWKIVRVLKLMFQHIMRSIKNQKFWFYCVCVHNILYIYIYIWIIVNDI